MPGKLTKPYGCYGVFRDTNVMKLNRWFQCQRFIFMFSNFWIHFTGDLLSFSGWWFQIVFIFTPIWGRFPIWLMVFKWVETTNQFFFSEGWKMPCCHCIPRCYNVWPICLHLGSFGLVNGYIGASGIVMFLCLDWGSSTQISWFPNSGLPQTFLSNEKRDPGCLGCIGDEISYPVI